MPYRKQFLDAIKQGAIDGWHKHKILPSIAGVQALHESDYGRSSLAKAPNYNIFGIKASADWKGAIVSMPTKEHVNGRTITIQANFRKYDSWGASVADYGTFFTSTEWRKNNYRHVVGERDYKKAAWALQNSGYATDPQYANKLIKRLEENGLQAWDADIDKAPTGTVNKTSVGGNLTQAGRDYLKNIPVTVLGDSLGVGTQPKLKEIMDNMTYSVYGSRQLTHSSQLVLDATRALESMLSQPEKVRNNLVVIIGTNAGLVRSDVDKFIKIAGNRKIYWVNTASKGVINQARRDNVTNEIRRAAETYSNVYLLDWDKFSAPNWSSYYGGDSVHMNATGYTKHAEFIAQGIYEVLNSKQTEAPSIPKEQRDDDGVQLKKSYIGIENVEYDDGRFYTLKGESSIQDREANLRFSRHHSSSFGWITRPANFDLDNTNELFTEALAKLKEYSEPKIDYEVPTKLLPNSIDIGDWVDIIDHQYTPPLYVKAQVKSMRESETDEDGNVATLANYQAVESGLAAELIEAQMKLKLIENSLSDENKIELSILSSQGAVFDGDITSTLLTAQLKLNGEIITNYADSYVWWRVVDPLSHDEEWIAEGGPSLTVYETEFKHNAIYKVLAKKDGRILSEGQYGLAKVVSGTHTGAESPVLAIDGETWTKPDGTQWTLVDGVWEEKVNQAQMFTVKADIDAAKVIADNAKAEADDARQRAEDALTEAGISTDLAQTAKDLAQLAEDNAETALTNAQTAINEAGIAASQAVQAINTADTAKTNAQTALTNAQTALTEAGSAKITANDLVIRVDEVEGELELKATQSEVDGISGTISNHSTTLTQQATQIASKAESSLVNTIKGTVDNHTTEIIQNATAIVSKAESSLVNTIKGTVDTHSTEISQNATEIASKASSTSVNTLTGRVSTAETTITQHATAILSKASQTEVDTVKGAVSEHTSTLSQQATQISARLTSTQVNNLVDGKGFATGTYVDSQIIATAESFGIELNRVENKIPSLNGLATQSWAQTQIDTKAGEINTNLSRVDSMASTGVETQNILNLHRFRRLVTDSFTIDGTNKTLSFSGTTGSTSIRYEVLKGELEEGKWYTFSFNLQTPSGNRFHIDVSEKIDSNPNSYQPPGRDNTGSYEIPFKYQSYLTNDWGFIDFNFNSGTSFFISNIKLNKGSSKSQDLVTSTQFQSVKETADRFTRVIGSTDAESRTKIAQIAMSDSVFQTTVRNSIQVGGGNLIKGSDFSDGSIALSAHNVLTEVVNIMNPYGVVSRVLKMDPTNDTHYLRFQGVIPLDQTEYTFSAWMKRVNGSPYNISVGINTDGATGTVLVGDAEWTKVVVTGKAVRGTGIYNFVDIDTNHTYVDLYIFEPKLEFGNVATAWNKSPVELANQSQVTQLANNWAVRMLNGKNDVVSQINLSDSTFLIEAKHIVGLGDAVINGKLTVTGDMIAGTISADKISGGTLTGTTFSTTASADDFTIELKNGKIDFKRAIFTMGTINLTKDANTLQPNGFAITQRPGYMFNIASVYNDGSTTSSPVLQIPANSEGASKKLNIYAQGGLYIDSDSFELNSSVATFNVPLALMNGLRASHTYNGTTINDAGNLMYVVDKDSSGVMFHRLGIRTKSGDWLSSRFEFYEDGRLARVANGVRTFF